MKAIQENDRHTLHNVQSGSGLALGIFPGGHLGITFDIHKGSAGTKLAHMHQDKVQVAALVQMDRTN